MTTTKEIGFADKYKSAVSVIERAKTLLVRTSAEHAIADAHLKTIRTLEKELEEEYKAHPVIVEAKRLQVIKGDLATMLETARKGLKNGAMLQFEQAEDAKRRAEEMRLAAEAKKKADAEAAAAAEIKRKEAAKAEAEAKRLAKKGDEEAAEAARARAEAARIEQEQIKRDAAMAPAVVVVLEKTTPTATRRTIPKFRIKDASVLPRQYTKPDEVAIGGVIRALRANHGIPGIEYFEELA